MSEVSKCLKAARELISKPENWTQGWYAKTIDDQTVYSRDANAVKWCAMGALAKVDGPSEVEAHNALRRAIERRGYSTIPQYNDTHTHEEVLSAFDEAIDIIEKGELA